MLVGFTGAQCTGKSTLLRRCKDELLNSGPWEFVDEVTRKVARGGHNINTQGNDMTQLHILKEHLENHTMSGDVILDRCIVDGFVYTNWLHDKGLVEKWIDTYACNLLSFLGERLDIIFYTCPDDIPMEDDGVRSTDNEFRDNIIDIYNVLLGASWSLPGRDTWRHKVIRLSGTVDERMETIKNTLEI